MYDFYKGRESKNHRMIFIHSSFQQGQIELLKQIKRKTNIDHEKNKEKHDERLL